VTLYSFPEILIIEVVPYLVYAVRYKGVCPSSIIIRRQKMKTDGIWFKDEQDRTLILRGVNLGGASKVPVTPDGSTNKKASLLDSRQVSFVGRPFPLEEADEHFSRLKSWGLTFVRFLVTWEAIEHSGPGIYDREYLSYVRSVIEKANGYGIDVFIDPHQDAWSRWTGGDGAPGWTLEMLGIDITKLHDAGAAFVHAYNGDPMPKMVWPTNIAKYGAATMFTLFFGGSVFAPRTLIEGKPVQEFLQEHYINAIVEVARACEGLPNVAGFDSLNEPNSGYIGIEDLATYRSWLKVGHWHTAFETMLLASGYSREVPYNGYKGFALRKLRDEIVNPDSVSIWKEGKECVWKTNGVWNDAGGKPELLSGNYFTTHNGKKVDFTLDFMKPFVKRYITGIRKVQPKAMIFIEEALGTDYIPWSENDGDQCVNATHWYDVLTLFTKTFRTGVTADPAKGIRFVFGEKGLVREFAGQLRRKMGFGTLMGGMPTLIGEIGLPMDLEDGKAYKTGDFSMHEKAYGIFFDAMDKLLLGCTIWNYTPDNTNELGDRWNGEDLSVFSRDQQKDPSDINSGGRATLGFVRPYARKIAGTPISMSFARKSRVFTLKYKSEPGPAAATEIFVPNIQYPNGFIVSISDGSYAVNKEDYSVTVCHSGDDRIHSVVIKPVVK
jgi:hypothetical protein